MAFDDEDDLTKWLQSQDAPNLTPQGSQPAAAGPGVWSKARDLMDRQAQMQYQPQDYSRFLGKSEAAPDRTGHDFRTILAMALDLFGNKGRGAGQLMAAGNQTFDQKEAQWKRENGPQAMLARQMQVKQLEGADRAAFNQDRSQLGAQIGQEVQLAGAQQAQGNADRTFEHTQERDMAGDVQHQMDHADTLDYQNRSLDQSKQLSEAQMKQSAAQAAASRAQALQFHRDAQAQHLADQEFNANQHLDDQQTMLGHQRRQEELEREKMGAAARKEAAQQSQHDAERSQDVTRNYVNDAKDTLANLPNLKTVDDILTKYKGKDIPGLGKYDAAGEPGTWAGRLQDMTQDPVFREDSLRMRNALGSLSTNRIKDISGSAVPDYERAILALQTGAGSMDEKSARIAIDQLRKAYQADLRGRATGREAEARNALKAYGYDSIFDPEPPPTDDPIISRYGGRLK